MGTVGRQVVTWSRCTRCPPGPPPRTSWRRPGARPRRPGAASRGPRRRRAHARGPGSRPRGTSGWCGPAQGASAPRLPPSPSPGLSTATPRGSGSACRGSGRMSPRPAHCAVSNTLLSVKCHSPDPGDGLPAVTLGVGVRPAPVPQPVMLVSWPPPRLLVTQKYLHSCPKNNT